LSPTNSWQSTTSASFNNWAQGPQPITPTLPTHERRLRARGSKAQNHEFAEVCGLTRLWSGVHFEDSVNNIKVPCTTIGAAAAAYVDGLVAGGDGSGAGGKGKKRKK